MITKIILLNGPAKSGKDTIGGQLQFESPSHYALGKFAHPIRLWIQSTLRITPSMLESEKDVQQELLNYMTIREAMIAYSEKFIKPICGNDWFGKRLRHELVGPTYAQVGVVTDSGFATEAQVLIDWFGAKNVLLVRLHREGASFEGDSRSYLSFLDQGVIEVDLHNDGTVRQAIDSLRAQASLAGFPIR